MPGLAGVYNPRANGEEIRRVLAQMRRVLDVPSIKYTVQVATGPGIGCLNFLRGDTHRERPVSNKQHRIWLILDGELYNADELRKRAAADVGRTRCLRTETMPACASRSTRAPVRRSYRV